MCSMPYNFYEYFLISSIRELALLIVLSIFERASSADAYPFRNFPIFLAVRLDAIFYYRRIFISYVSPQL